MQASSHSRRLTLGRNWTRLASALSLASAALVLWAPTDAHAQDAEQATSSGEDTVSACLSAHTRGQELKRDGHLLESRDTLRECSASQCPSALIRDCSEWLQQL